MGTLRQILCERIGWPMYCLTLVPEGSISVQLEQHGPMFADTVQVSKVQVVSRCCLLKYLLATSLRLFPPLPLIKYCALCVPCPVRNIKYVLLVCVLGLFYINFPHSGTCHLVTVVEERKQKNTQSLYISGFRGASRYTNQHSISCGKYIKIYKSLLCKSVWGDSSLG